MNRNVITHFLLVLLTFLSSCEEVIEVLPYTNETSTEISNTYFDNKNEILLINEKFYSNLVNSAGSGETKIEEAFKSLGIYEPIIFSVFKGGVSRKKVNSGLSGGDFSKIVYSSEYDYYFYYLQNYQGAFVVNLPGIPCHIDTKWHSSDTTFFNTRDYVSNMTIKETAYIIQDKNDSSIFLLNGKFKMKNISSLLIDKSPIEEKNHNFFVDVLNIIVLKECSDSLYRLYNPDKWWNHNNVLETIVDKKEAKPISYFPKALDNVNAQVKYQTKEISYIPVIFFPKRNDRDALNISKLDNVYGVNQFFMDHDLTSGYVHPFTKNFFNMLSDDGFVLCFKRSLNRVNEATAFYVRKKDLSTDDVLGQNLAFCRQWKLSEINFRNDEVFLKKCNYNKNCNCLQVKDNSDNPYSPEIPLWSSHKKEGYISIDELNGFGDFDGGTVTIIWESNNKGVLFKEVYGSIKDILIAAIEIRDKYNTDPVLGIFDAGSYARKFQSINGVIDFDIVNRKTGKGQFVGAGYGYIMK
jgi:hypothetical protein